MAGFALDLAGVLVPIGIAIADGLQTKAGPQTTVSIVVGDGNATSPLSGAGGTVPHVALWDNNGNRIGQWHPSGNDDKVWQDSQRVITVDHNQNGGKDADPLYVMLSQLDTDAVCISAIQVSNGIISGSFYGDTGFTCGQSWFYSTRAMGDSFITPKCVWLDADHTNDINARAVSFHVNDLIPATDKLDEYSANTDYLCKSSPRFSFWGNLLPNGIPPFFDPPLQYQIDSVSGGQGADVDPDLVIDKVTYDKSVYMYQGEPKSSKRASRPDKPRSTNRDGYNPDPSHLVITQQVGHSAKELCEHPNSYGPDLVSLNDGLYCDMVDKTLYNLCDKRITSNCFDLGNRRLVGLLNARGESSTAGVRQKLYENVAEWK